MNGSLYIRIRGSKQGPYTFEQLQAFAKQGRLSRLHEVSPDDVAWVRASTFPELFGNEPVVVDTPVRQHEPEPSYTVAPTPAAQAAANVSRMTQERCYYTSNGVEYGPVSFASLQALVASGRISDSDLVLIDESSDWVSPQRVAGLMQATSGAAAPTVDSEGMVSIESLRAIACMRPWIMFVAVTGFVFVVLLLISSIMQLVEGGRLHLGLFIASGLGGIILGVLGASVSWMLVVYFNRLGDVMTARDEARLSIALHVQRRLWMLLGILVLFCLSFALLAAISVIAVGTSF